MTSESRPITEYGLLGRDKTFSQLIYPFVLPYFAYVGIGGLLSGLLPIEVIGVLKFISVILLLWFFRKAYRFGPSLKIRQIPVAIGAGILATLLWIVVLRLSLELPFWKNQLETSAMAAPSIWQWIFRALGSTLLVPVFEELLCRVYLAEYLYNMPAGSGGFAKRLGQVLDLFPKSLSKPPLTALSLIGSTICFTMGHNPSSWPAAIAYFLFTGWVYQKTRSLRICILIHALANFTIAVLVLWRPEMRFLW